MEKTYITITNLDDFRAAEFVNIGDVFTLKKQPNNYDDETIVVLSTKGTKYGYVANSSATVAHGTHSAGYIYRDFDQETKCIVRFRIDDVAIAELLDPNESLFSEYLEQNRDQHFVKASGEEREEVLDYLKENGFTVDEERFTEEEILNSPYPIGVEISTKKIFLIAGAAMAGAAASSDMIFTAENFIKMFQELTENNPR